MHRLLVLAALLVALPAWAGAPAKAKAKKAPEPVFAYIVPDSSLGDTDSDYLKSVAGKVRGRRGVKKATVEGKHVVLEIQLGAFRAADVIRGIEGMKVEMRVPYKTVHLDFLAEASFPPIARVEGDAVTVEMGEAVRKAIESAIRFKPPERMKCYGKTVGPEANEAVLSRYEEEKRPPVSMLPFMAEADLDGDKRQDLYLRFEGASEFVIFNKADGLKAVPVKREESEGIPRCDLTPTRYAKPVGKQKIKCMSETEHVGDAIERVQANRSNNLLMWDGKGFTTCEPLGEGAMPTAPRPPPGEGQQQQQQKKPADEDNW